MTKKKRNDVFRRVKRIVDFLKVHFRYSIRKTETGGGRIAVRLLERYRPNDDAITKQ